MIRCRLAEPSIHAHLGRAFVVLAVACAGVLALLAVRFGMMQAQHTQAIDDSVRARTAIKEASGTVAKAEAVKPSGNAAGITAGNGFQRALVDAAAANNCSVREVSLAADLQPFLTRYQTDTPKSDFMQASFRAVISGSPQAVVSTLQALTKGTIPFEFDSVQFSRTSVDKFGSTVDASIELRVLTKELGK